MIIHTMKDRGIHAAALQETWAAVPPGRDNDEIDGFLIIRHGETVRSCNRGRLGVVIILSPIARLAWEARGELVRKDREGRVMAVDLALEGHRTLRLGSACSPATGASSNEGQAIYDGVTHVLGSRAVWATGSCGFGRVTGACVRPSLAVAVGHAPV